MKENQLNQEIYKGKRGLVLLDLGGDFSEKSSNSEEMSSLSEESEDVGNEDSIDFAIGYLHKDEKEDEGWLFLNEMM